MVTKIKKNVSCHINLFNTAMKKMPYLIWRNSLILRNCFIDMIVFGYLFYKISFRRDDFETVKIIRMTYEPIFFPLKPSYKIIPQTFLSISFLLQLIPFFYFSWSNDHGAKKKWKKLQIYIYIKKKIPNLSSARASSEILKEDKKRKNVIIIDFFCSISISSLFFSLFHRNCLWF